MGSDSLQGWELALCFFVCVCKEPPALIARVAFSFEKVKRVNQSFCSTVVALLTLIRVALEENLKLLFKTILHHDALS